MTSIIYKFSLTLLALFVTYAIHAQTPTFNWAAQLGSTIVSDCSINAMTLDASENVYSIGTFSGTADFDPSTSSYNLTTVGNSNYDVFISKLDSNKNFIWAKQLKGKIYATANSIAVDAASNVYITGSFQDTIDADPGIGVHNLISNGGDDIFIVELNASGNFVWATQIGDAFNDEGNGIAINALGDMYITGSFEGTVDFNHSTAIFNLTSSGIDIFVLKLDASGNFVWVKQMGGSGYDVANSIALDTIGNVYTTGTFETVADFDPSAATANLIANLQDVFISKLSASGNFIWAKQIKGDTTETASTIALDHSGNIYIGGNFQNNVDFDPSAATYTLSAPFFSTQIFICKLNSNGNFLWAKQMKDSTNSFGGSTANHFAFDAENNVYITGGFQGTVDFNPSPTGTYNLSTIGNTYDIFISELDTAGNFIWALNMGSNSPTGDFGTSICVTSLNSIYTAGFFTGTIDCNPDATITANLTASGHNGFIQKLNQSIILPQGIENIVSTQIAIYPNPASQSLSLEAADLNQYSHILITDLLGKEIYNNALNTTNNKAVINITAFQNGIYFYALHNQNGKTINGKFCVLQ